MSIWPTGHGDNRRGLKSTWIYIRGQESERDEERIRDERSKRAGVNWGHERDFSRRQTWERTFEDILYDEPSQKIFLPFSSVQSLSRVRLFATPWIAARQASLSITISRNSLKHIRQAGDAIQLSHPLSSPCPPAPNPSQHQGLFQWVNSSHEVAKVLEFQLQHQSFQWTPRTDLL